MTDLITRPETTEVTIADTIRSAVWLTDSQRRNWPDYTSTSDDMRSLRRALSGVYLTYREMYEDCGSPAAEVLAAESAALLARVLVASGEAADVDAARGMVESVTGPQMAERFVEKWANREDLLWDLSSDAICAVADNVRDWVAEGGELGQMPMREWTAPYLAVAR